MELNFMTRLKHSWNAFMNRDPTYNSFRDIGMSSSFRPDRPRLTRGNERTIITAIYNRIATDVSGININHCTSNEIRQIIGMKPSNDPKADRLINSNLNQPEDAMNKPVDGEELKKNPENYDQPEEQQENTSQNEDISIMDIPISQLSNYV